MTEESKKVLVTGGSGFIGSNLVRELEKRGHEVWVCDLMHSCRSNYVRCDVGKFRQVERLFEEHGFDFVYHAAAEYGRWNGEDYYENLWLTNAVGTKNILRLQEKKRFRMVFFGSAEVPRQYVFDAYHIASASLGRFEALVTWNFEHILREKTEWLLETINREKNVHVPRLRSPEV